MSNQYKAGVVTTLEQVFLSSEFACTLDRRAVFNERAQGAGLEALDQAALWPETKSRTCCRPGCGRTTAPAPLPPSVASRQQHWWSPGSPRVARSSGRRACRRKARDRLPFGTGGRRQLPGGAVACPGPRERDARRIVRPKRRAPRFPDGTDGPHGDGTARPSGMSGQPPAATVEVPPGTTVTLVPSPATPQSGPTSAGTGGATSSQSPTSATPSNATAPAIVVVGNTVTTVGSVVTTANHVGSAVPTIAPGPSRRRPAHSAPERPAHSAPSRSVTGLAQNLNSTTA